jgi:hypothetical protein
LAKGRDAFVGGARSVAASGGVGAGWVRDSLGGTAFFLRAARSVLLFDIVTLALIPSLWDINPCPFSIPAQRLLYQTVVTARK